MRFSMRCDNTYTAKQSADGTMTAAEHLNEFRSRLIVCLLALTAGTAVSFFFVKEIITFLTAPAGHLYFIRPAEVILIYAKTALISGLILSLPVLLLELWRFLYPALSYSERNLAARLIPAVSALFLLGISFAFFFIIPQSLRFLTTLGGDTLQPMLSMESYLNFLFAAALPFGLISEIPVLMVVAVKARWIQPFQLRKKRKYIIMASLILSALITPTPDIFTQLLLACPMILLYEISCLAIIMTMKSPSSHINPHK